MNYLKIKKKITKIILKIPSSRECFNILYDRYKMIVKYPFIKKNDDIIIIAGIGRCGTTLMYKIIKQKYLEGGFFKNIDDIISHGKVNRVYKTHDYPPKKKLPNNVKIIYMYGNPMNSALSVYLNNMGKKHYEHLKVSFNDKKDVLYKDVLDLERNFDAWKKFKSDNLLFLKYETFYLNRLKIEDYIGYNFIWPKFRMRESSWENSSYKKQLEKTYFEFDKKINDTGEFMINNN